MKAWITLFMLVAPSSALSQLLSESRVAFPPATRPLVVAAVASDTSVATQRPRPRPVLVTGGLAGLGLWSAWMAAAVRNCGEYDFHCLVVPLAQPLAVPLGVHLANSARGSLGGSVARSYLVTGLGLIAGKTLGAEEAEYGWPVTLVTITAAQLAIAVAVEERTTGAGHRPRRVTRDVARLDSVAPAELPRHSRRAGTARQRD